VKDFWKFLWMVVREWRGILAIVMFILAYVSRLGFNIERTWWYVYLSPSLWILSVVILFWSTYVAHQKLFEPIETQLLEKSKMVETLSEQLYNRHTMVKIRLQKLVGELRYNRDHTGQQFDTWMDNAWLAVDEALPAIPPDLLEELQRFYQDMRAAMRTAHTAPSFRLGEFRAGAKGRLDLLITKLEALIPTLPG
jgi:hypothetical protein